MLFKYPPNYSRGSQIIRYNMQLIPSEINMARNSFVPTQVTVGITEGFSLPISTGSDAEYIHATTVVPAEWDQTSNPSVAMVCAIDTTNNNKNFKIELEWTYFRVGYPLNTMGASNIYSAETNTGTGTQYMVYTVVGTLDRDVAAPTYHLQPGDVINVNVRRKAASSLEITGEVIVLAAYMTYWRGYYGGS